MIKAMLPSRRLALFFCAALLTATLQAESRAVLVSGTERVKGIADLPRNALPALRGAYDWEGTRIVVHFTREAIPIEKTAPRLKATAFLLIKAETKTILYHKGEGFLLLVAPDADRPDIDRFATVFIDRFNYFRSFAKTDAELSFPAVLAIK